MGLMQREAVSAGWVTPEQFADTVGKKREIVLT
jgi:hypothetical protein